MARMRSRRCSTANAWKGLRSAPGYLRAAPSALNWRACSSGVLVVIFRIRRNVQTHLQFRGGRYDLLPERLERRDLVYIGHVEDQVLDTRLAKISAHLDYVIGADALRTEVGGAKGRTLYLLVVPPHVLSVALQYLQLVPIVPAFP